VTIGSAYGSARNAGFESGKIKLRRRSVTIIRDHYIALGNHANSTSQPERVQKNGSIRNAYVMGKRYSLDVTTAWYGLLRFVASIPR
jgi:hypothetical protein